MKKIALVLASALVMSASMAQKMEKTVQVGGAAMFPSKNIVQNAVNSKDHTTLVAAVKAAGLVDTLSSKGPFTVFALTKILTYHVVAGKMNASDLTDGKRLKTVEGEDLTVKHSGGKVWIVDAK